MNFKLSRGGEVKMLKVRTAKKEFTGSCGKKVKAGEPFLLVELRPLFISREEAAQVLEDLVKRPKAA